MFLQDREHSTIAARSCEKNPICADCGHVPAKRRRSVRVLFAIFRVDTGPKCHNPLPKGMDWAPECLCSSDFHITNQAQPRADREGRGIGNFRFAVRQSTVSG